MRVLASSKHAVLAVNIIIQEKVCFIRKTDIIQEFLDVIGLFQKNNGTWLPSFHIGLCPLILNLDPARIKFEILNQNEPNRRYRYSKLLAPPVAKIRRASGRLNLEP